MNKIALPIRTISFPSESDIVYVFGFRDGSDFVPFYVGESARHLGRLGDYISAKFSAQTDFKVGVAAKTFRELGFAIEVKYEETTNRKRREQHLLAALKGKYRLLNDFKGYSYRAANEEDERSRIEEFVRSLVSERVNGRTGIAEPVLEDSELQRFSTATVVLTNTSDWPPLARAMNEAGQLLKEKHKNRIPYDAIVKEVCRLGPFKKSSVLPYDYCINHKNADPRSGRYRVFRKLAERGFYEYVGPME